MRVERDRSSTRTAQTARVRRQDGAVGISGRPFSSPVRTAHTRPACTSAASKNARLTTIALRVVHEEGTEPSGRGNAHRRGVLTSTRCVEFPSFLRVRIVAASRRQSTTLDRNRWKKLSSSSPPRLRRGGANHTARLFDKEKTTEERRDRGQQSAARGL